VDATPSTSPVPDLGSFDVVLINSSGGKDSQVMLDEVVALATAAGVRDRLVVVHCDLGRVEWAGTRELAERQAAHYGVRFEVVRRPQGDLLQQVRARRMWPSPKQRYCTSDQKRGQVRRLMTQLTAEVRARCGKRRVRILNCMGMRADESPARSKLVPYAMEKGKGASNGKREVWTWLPVHAWTVAQVWERIRVSGVPHHPAYDLGMPRLSCCFCIFAPRDALVLAGKHNRALLAEYVATEAEIGHTFKKDLTLAEVQAAVMADEPTRPLQSWVM
jgi:3'-phosphoadenosine 5'-phosphosulfate sulfotransferase (PAPS reductase)/FAD synthetase